LKILLSITSSIIVWCCSLPAQNLEQTIHYADEQFHAKKYESAISAYSRVLFFDRENNHKRNVCQKLARCYIQNEEYNKAVYFTDLAFNLSFDDSIKNELVLQKTSALILSHEYKYANLELLNLNSSISPYLRYRKEFYLGVIHFQQENFEKSRQYFINCIPTDSLFSRREKELGMLFEKNRKTKRFHPKGQLYCGDFRNALNSFLITFSFGALFRYTAITYSLLDAFVAVMPWYQRYYLGGFHSAEMIARKKIKTKQNEIFENILDVIASTKVRRL